MKRLLMVAAVSVTLGAGADYVWINETDTTYDWGAAWDHNGVHEWPTQAPSENVTIAKPVTVTYTTGFDFEPQAGTVFTPFRWRQVRPEVGYLQLAMDQRQVRD